MRNGNNFNHDPRRPRRDAEPPQETELDECLIEGRNAVTEALKAGRCINKLFLAEGAADHGLTRLASLARETGAVISTVDRRKLDSMSPTGAHQGVIAMAAAHTYATLEDMFQRAADRGEAPMLVLCDELSDPHNLGAVIRTAECAGAHGVIIPKRRAAPLTAVVAKASAGALEYMPVTRVSNMTQTIQELKQRGVWVFGTAANGQTPLHKADFQGPVAIVIGSEGDGMGRLVSENCDFKVSIPMKGEISSLNASAAAAILLYEAVRQRDGQK